MLQITNDKDNHIAFPMFTDYGRHGRQYSNILAIEKVYNRGQQIFEKRENLWINKLEAEYNTRV